MENINWSKNRLSIDYSCLPSLGSKLDQALLALGRLDGLARSLPDS
jgi:hypothetical protein